MFLILMKRFGRTSLAILLVSDLLHPVHHLSALRFLDGDVRHRGCSRRTVPMLQTGREPNNVARPNLFHWSALALSPAHAGRDNQRLPERMCVPRSACTGLKGDASGGCSRRVLRLK